MVNVTLYKHLGITKTNMKNSNFVELFAGIGGLSEGFLLEGFEPVALIEKDEYCCETLKTRHAYHFLKNSGRINFYKKYLKGELTKERLYSKIPKETLDSVICAEINRENLPKLTEEIRKRLGKRRLDVVLGGPPCQAYSTSGRSYLKRNKNDERLSLYKFYAEILEEFRPKLFLFENVLGLLSLNKGKQFEKIKEAFQKAGYNIACEVLNANDYGVLQRRKRIILIGTRKDLNLKFSFENLPKIKNKWTVSEILEDLGKIKQNEEKNEYETAPGPYLKKFKIRQKQDILTCHRSRFTNDRDMEIYRQAVRMWNRHKKRLKYNELKKELITHKNSKTHLDRFKIVAADLPYSHTMVAHISQDGHYYIHPDIRQNRSITPREAARIQSFPDNYFFEGPRSAQFRQIGNAVPPLLSKTLAKEVKRLGERKL